MMIKNIILTICLSLFLAGGLFSQETVYVSATGGGDNDGTSEANAYGNFATALGQVDSPGDVLRVLGDINITGGQNISSKTFAFIIEGDSDYSTLTGANGITRMFTINSGTGHNVTFKNLIITGATNSTGSGAVIGVYSNSTITIDNCVFNGNSSINNAGGGAILINNSSANLTVNDTSFYQNSSTASGGQGGAIAILASASAALTNCTFFENKITRADKNFGGAIRTNSTSPLTVTNCLFYNNKANNGAGGNCDVMGTGTSGRTITNSILQFTNNTSSGSYVNNNSTITDSDFLATSNLSWDATLNKVTYTAPDALTSNTPIDFGSDTEDVGAYDSKINLFEGTTDSDWGIAGNWSGTVPSSADNATFLSDSPSVIIGSTLGAVTNNLSVHSNSSLTVNSGGSLIVSGTSTGDVTYNRNLPTTNWYFVSSPISGQAYDDTYVTDNGITSGTGNNRGIATYTTVDNNWSYLLSGGTGSFNNGQGYSVNRDTTGDISFTGTINTTDVSVAVTNSGTGFNLIGNPFTSHLTSATFLTDNTAKLASQTLWVWNQGTSSYDTYVTGDLFVLAPAQGFFVRSSNGTNLNIAESYQASTGGTFQKSAKTEVKLMMNDGSADRFAKMYYLDNATKGFDNGFDGETFGGIDDILGVFTHLVADNQGKKYQVQSLPISEMESMIIPVGIIAEAGKELTFSMTGLNIPSDVKIYLEDRVANTFNELTDSKTFKVTLSEALNDVGRFYIHSSKSALSADDALALNGVSIYKSNATTLKVVGLPNGTSNIKLFNILGKQVLNTSFIASGVKEITLPKLAIGVYIVQLETETSKLNKKIVLE